ncbi:MAG: phosphatase [Thermonemataceae bacterium]|nr:phosphatase [Thermonemataceae bacterium]
MQLQPSKKIYYEEQQELENIAVIDIGTNTAHLLVVSLSSQRNIFTPFRVLHKEKITTKIGEGGISEGYISLEAQKRLLNALKHFKEVLDYYEIREDALFAVATSALRNAKNQRDTLEKVFEETQIKIEVISGEKEAEYIYYGVKTALKIGPENALIMDIGGGSVEFILCNDSKLYWKESFEIGAQRLLDKFMPQERISETNINLMNDFLHKKLQNLSRILSLYPAKVVIGCSGTFDTLDDINHLKKHRQLNYNAKESAFSITEFKAIYQEILSKNHQERLAIPGMSPMRADMIVVASSLLNFILDTYQIPQVRVSHYALKEGLLAKKINII